MSERIPFKSPIRRLKTLPVLPTLLTAGNLACGVTAIMCAAQELLLVGAILIFVAMVCDMLDGKVARMTKTEGAFGGELDSLADVVSFGVAPAMLVHRLVLEEPGVFGPGERLIWLVTIFYCVMAAIRLARYNVEHEDDKTTDDFSGLPSPGAAALICSWIIVQQRFLVEDGALTLWFGDSAPFAMQTFKVGLMGMILLCGFLMVSNIPFPHVGNSLLGNRLHFRRVVLLILCILLFAFRPAPMLALLTTGYVAYGFVPGFIAAMRRWIAGRSLLDDDDDDEDDELDDDAAQQQNAG